jgi:hypothetical protein
VISIFHRTKIPTVDMKVQVHSRFSKNKIWKKVKSPNSVRNGRFNTSKCRGKLQKMGVLYIHSPKRPSPFPKLPKKNSKKTKQSAQGQVLACGRLPAWAGCPNLSLCNFLFISHALLFLHIRSTPPSWL